MTQSDTPKDIAKTVAQFLFVGLQYLIPHHLLSSLMHSIARIELKPFKDLLIRQAIKWYKVDMQEALQSDPTRYRCFNDFFTRALRPDARPVTQWREKNIQTIPPLTPPGGAEGSCST
ncbi:MAG: phosphatidylserine decarboxylase, partial [Candidatus Thiodiazotropha sp.]